MAGESCYSPFLEQAGEGMNQFRILFTLPLTSHRPTSHTLLALHLWRECSLVPNVLSLLVVPALNLRLQRLRPWADATVSFSTTSPRERRELAPPPLLLPPLPSLREPVRLEVKLSRVERFQVAETETSSETENQSLTVSNT